LKFNGIDDESMVFFSKKLKYLPSLKILELSQNCIGAKGGEALAENVHHLPKLTHLALQLNMLGDAGVYAIVKALDAYAPQLQLLKLGFNDLTLNGWRIIDFLMGQSQSRIFQKLRWYDLFPRETWPFLQTIRKDDNRCTLNVEEASEMYTKTKNMLVSAKLSLKHINVMGLVYGFPNEMVEEICRYVCPIYRPFIQPTLDKWMFDIKHMNYDYN
jgi:hypothetical protein